MSYAQALHMYSSWLQAIKSLESTSSSRWKTTSIDPH